MRTYASEDAHAASCVARHGCGKSAVKNCNRCQWMKNRPRWIRACPFLVEAPSGPTWGLGCKVCASAESSQKKGTSWTEYTVGSSPANVLQIEDLKRHAKTALHQALMRSQGQGPGPAVPGDGGHWPQNSLVPTAAQIRLSIEVARTPLGAQSLEYERKAMLAARSDQRNFPGSFNTRDTHSRIVKSIATVLQLGNTR